MVFGKRSMAERLRVYMAKEMGFQIDSPSRYRSSNAQEMFLEGSRRYRKCEILLLFLCDEGPAQVGGFDRVIEWRDLWVNVGV